MLWDLIRDFFVEHVFGGFSSSGSFYDVKVGYVYGTGDTDGNVGIDYLTYHVNTTNSGEGIYLNLGDWLSTTATIISITIIVVLCCLFVYKIIKLIGGLIR